MTIIGEQLEAILAKREGDEEPVRAWKEHNVECSKVKALSVNYHLMHRKVDHIVSFLGIVLYHPGMEQLATEGLVDTLEGGMLVPLLWGALWRQCSI